MRRVVLIFGPPGSGKTTLARTLGLAVYDRDDPGWTSEQHFRRAIAQLATQPNAQAVVIRAGSTPTARARAARLVAATEQRLLLVDADTCRQRVTARKQDTQHLRKQMAGITSWWTRYQPDPPGGAQLSPGKSPTGDPALKTAARKHLRAEVARQRRGCEIPTCVMPNRIIDYDATDGPWAYVLDEIVPRWRGGDPADPRNVRPAHARCNGVAGARMANAIKAAKKPREGEQASTASRW